VYIRVVLGINIPIPVFHPVGVVVVELVAPTEISEANLEEKTLDSPYVVKVP
jgi:hypothetical protein